MPCARASSTIDAKFPSMSSSEIGPVLPAMSLVPARITTTFGASATTSQMLVRFRNDVIALRPKVVVILAGTNDIAGNTGPITPEDIQGNVASMVELARAHGIRVVLSSVIPVHNYTPAAELTYPRRPPDQIVALNKWLKDYAAASGCVYLDYAAAMSDDKRVLRRELADDGLHPNKAGYAVMAPLAEQAIAKALAGG